MKGTEISRSRVSRLALTCLLVGSLVSSPVHSFGQQRACRQALSRNLQTKTIHTTHIIQLSSTSRSSPLYLAKDSKTKGVYSRPSAAIERGSGFFIPGLEGPRVRLLFGIVILILTALNHSTTSSTNAFAEGLGVFYAILLLLQAAIEFGKEEKGYVVTLDKTDEPSASSTLSQTWSSSIDKDVQEKVEWAAASYVALTPATHMLLLDREKGILYRLGSTALPRESNGDEGTRAAFAVLDKATSDRVSLPPTHPAVVALSTEEHGRCVVLQRVNDNQCWMMTSNQLLAAFTKQDLKWLGQMAKHIS